MVVVKATKVKTKGLTKRETYAMVCYYYPAYTLKQVSRMPARDITLLIKTARKLEATRLYNLTQIVMAPHTKKGSAVKKLLDHFKKMAGS